MTNHYIEVCEETIASLRQQLAEARKHIMVMTGHFQTIINTSPWEVSHGDIALKALSATQNLDKKLDGSNDN